VLAPLTRITNATRGSPSHRILLHGLVVILEASSALSVGWCPNRTVRTA
jgi:hypothetical protein